MNQHDLHLILHALSTPNASFVLGAGASAPAVPTFTQLAERIAQHAPHLHAFPASAIPDSPLRALMQPVLERAQLTSDISEWKAGAMTTATIAAILEQMISLAHRQMLPQYQVFSLFSSSASVVSFNWDGLARARCPQHTVLHPHGLVAPRVLSEGEFDNLLFNTQDIDDISSRRWFLPGLVFPGEETSSELEQMREEVRKLWTNAGTLIVVGYSFGLASHLRYDEIWLGVFAESCLRNSATPVHIFAPDAAELRLALCERLKRNLDIFAWPVRWNVLSRLLIEMSANESAPLAGLRFDSDRMAWFARELSTRSE